MTVLKITHRISLVFACLVVFALTSASSPALAQKGLWNKTKEGVQKGAEGVKKGAETVGEKTKEGAETVGRETKEFVTGEEDTKSNRGNSTEVQSQGTTTTPSQSTITRSQTTRSSSTRSTHTSKSTGRELPKTAGDLSLLGLAGALAFAGAGFSKLRGMAK